ncbi:hypothetical protein [Leminorella grimontii]|uniref:hypothetical protein n=1 Tax=Leminorella grimontii TaxID=82981 RepID=UPI0020892A04|nr:hypothetical protein [Leminorella grimontii]GKX57793.1 hypothetical protein SOASR031_01080 [Leminorella grimontii]
MTSNLKSYRCDRCGNYIHRGTEAEEESVETGRTKIEYQATFANKSDSHWLGSNYSGIKCLCLACTRDFLSFIIGEPTPAPANQTNKRRASRDKI